MIARVHVFYKSGIFDPQGNTIEKSLHQLGFKEVSNVRVGKAIDLHVDSSNEAEARQKVGEACSKLLVNPVIESYTVEFPKST